MVSLSPSTAIILREHREQQEKIRQSLGLTLTDDDLIFSDVDGRAILLGTMSHAWTKLVN